MSKDTIDELAYNYGWEKWGGVFIRQRACDELFIDTKFREFGIRNEMRSTTLKYNLTSGNIKTLIKLFGAKL